MAKTEAKTNEEKMDLNTAMSEVEALIKKMEDPDTSLEESFADYSKGMELLKYCSESIDRVEKELEILEEQQ